MSSTRPERKTDLVYGPVYGIWDRWHMQDMQDV